MLGGITAKIKHKNYSNKSKVNISTSPKRLPKTRDELRRDLENQGFQRAGSTSSTYETWKKPAQGEQGQITINIKPTGEVIRTQKVWNADRTRKYGERQDYFGNRLPDQSHSTGHYVE